MPPIAARPAAEESASESCRHLERRLSNLEDEMDRLIGVVEDNSRAVKRIAEILQEKKMIPETKKD